MSVKVKSGQTVESIEQTRREEGDEVVLKRGLREGIEDDWKRGIDEWDGERFVSLLRLENSPDVRESRWLLSNDD